MSLVRSEMVEIEDSSPSEPYLAVEDVARRLDLPLGVLLRRVEAGDVPSRREHGPFGVRYSVRLSDLGFDPLEVVGSAHAWPRREPDPEPPDADVAAAMTVQQLPQPTAQSMQIRPADPHRELAAMTLDPRELVAGLLDRWERTLEQRIYAEQRIRFEAELNARQNLVKQLQLELTTARAEQAAALAERDRRLAENERRNAELQGELNSAREAAARRRGLFRH